MGMSIQLDRMVGTDTQYAWSLQHQIQQGTDQSNVDMKGATVCRCVSATSLLELQSRAKEPLSLLTKQDERDGIEVFESK